MSSPSDKFLEALSIFERQVAEATQYWFAAATINEVSKNDRKVFRAFQATPLFWLTVRGGLEHQAIIALARIFGQRAANPINIDSLRQLIYESRATVFSKAAFAARGKPKELVDRAHELTPADFRRMSTLVKKYRKFYEEQFAPIRNRYIAHSDEVTAADLSGMFAKTRIRDFERMLEFLNRFHDALWHLYYNGMRPTFRVHRSSVRALVRDRVDQLGRAAIPEDIVRQTRTALGLVALGHSSRRGDARNQGSC
jgi:hypothetical protein